MKKYGKNQRPARQQIGFSDFILFLPSHFGSGYCNAQIRVAVVVHGGWIRHPNGQLLCHEPSRLLA